MGYISFEKIYSLWCFFSILEGSSELCFGKIRRVGWRQELAEHTAKCITLIKSPQFWYSETGLPCSSPFTNKAMGIGFSSVRPIIVLEIFWLQRETKKHRLQKLTLAALQGCDDLGLAITWEFIKRNQELIHCVEREQSLVFWLSKIAFSWGWGVDVRITFDHRHASQLSPGEQPEWIFNFACVKLPQWFSIEQAKIYSSSLFREGLFFSGRALVCRQKVPGSLFGISQ